MLEFILTLVVILALVIASFIIIKLIQKYKLEPKIIQLIIEAEKQLGNGKGAEKFEYVFDEVYNKLVPGWFKLLFSAKEVRQIIQFVFDKVKTALHYKGE